MRSAPVGNWIASGVDMAAPRLLMNRHPRAGRVMDARRMRAQLDDVRWLRLLRLRWLRLRVRWRRWRRRRWRWRRRRLVRVNLRFANRTNAGDAFDDRELNPR